MLKAKHIELNKIMATKDLEFFKGSEFNRDIKTVQVNKLKKSMREYGQLDPIKIRKDGTIIDGHHRFEAIKELILKENSDLLVKYIIIEAKDEVKSIIELNSTAIGWGSANYIKIYAKDKNPQYQKIIDVAEKYNQTPISVATLVCFGSDCSRYRDKIKNGEDLDFVNWDVLEEYYKYLETLVPYIQLKCKVKQMLFRLYTLNKFDPNIFYKKISNEFVMRNEKMRFSSAQNICKDQLLSIYNKGQIRSGKNYIKYHKDVDNKIIIEDV